MKNLIVVIALVLVSKFGFAQKQTLALDEHNKYIYYQTAEQPGASAHDLYTRCYAGLSKTYTPKEIKGKPDSQILVNSKVVLYAGLTKHEDGQVTYQLHTEFKDGKYRYWLSDFVFTPYQRDRYNNYVPIAGKELPLEQAKGKVDKSSLDNYMDQLMKHCKQVGENLKQFAANAQKQEEKAQKVDTHKW